MKPQEKIPLPDFFRLYIELGASWRRMRFLRTFLSRYKTNLLPTHEAVLDFRRKIHKENYWMFKRVVISSKKHPPANVLVMLRRNIGEMMERRLDSLMMAGKIEFEKSAPDTIYVCVVGDCGRR